MSTNKHTSAVAKKAVAKKDKGNEAFRCNDFKSALDCYNESLSIYPLAATYNNRAMVFIKLERYDEAIKDCHEVIIREPCNPKAYYRRSFCYKSTGELRNALRDIKTSLEWAPDSKDVKKLRDDIELILALNKCEIKEIPDESQRIPEISPNMLVPTIGVICQCKDVAFQQVSCTSNSKQKFHYIPADNEVHYDEHPAPLSDINIKCSRCKSHWCYVWNTKSNECIPNYTIFRLIGACALDFFPEEQAYHDYGFCNMEFFYKEEYLELSLRSYDYRDPSQILLGLYKDIKGNFGSSSISFPLLNSLHQACMENSLDAYIQQYIKTFSERYRIDRGYLHMWRERKYIIGPTRLSVNDTAKDVVDVRNKLYNYFYANPTSQQH